jgi:hypothetical protein
VNLIALAKGFIELDSSSFSRSVNTEPEFLKILFLGLAIIFWESSLVPSSTFSCGTFPDVKIARRDLVHHLLAGEKYIADRGYRDGGLYADTPTG